MTSKAETYWLDVRDPVELERRANDFQAEGMFALAQEFRDRARQIRERLIDGRAKP